MNTEVNRPNKVVKGPRACVTCARAKSRCIPGPNANGGKCERCHRLDKPCSSQTPAPPRKRKEPKPTRVAELERKLEDLTARLESAAGAGANQSQGRSPSRGLSEEAVQDNHRTTIAGSSQPLVNANTWDISQPTAATNGANHNGNNPTIDYNFAHIFGTDGPLYNQVELPPSTPSTHLKDSSSLGSSRSNELRGGQPPSPQVPPHITTPKPLLWPEDAEAEAMLTLYQATLAHHFPFTPIDPRLSSRELRQKRPFVWKAAMMSAYHLDGPRQTALGNQLLKEIIEAAMVSAQKDLDLLQGLQLLICWYHYNLKSSQLTNLVFLARSICSSLGLTESTHLNSVKGRLDQFTPKCLDNMRALTGTYYITTVTFATNRRPDAFMSTSCAELCCEIIEKLNKTPSDIFLVWLVRIQQLIQAIVWRLALCQSTTLRPNHMPLAAVIREFAQQIEVFKQSVPQNIADNPTLIGHIYVAEMLLYEIAIHPSHPDESTNLNLPPSPPSSSSPSAASSHSHSHPTISSNNNNKRPRGTGLSLQDRFDFLWSCLRAAKGFLVNRYAFSVGSPSSIFACTLEEQRQELEYRLRNPRFSCISSSDFIYAFLTSLRLIMLSLPGWDLDVVRREMCFVDFLERQCVEMEIITAGRQSQFSQVGVPLAAGTIDMFPKLTKKMRSLSEQLRAELETSYSPSQINQQQQSQNQTRDLQEHIANTAPLATIADSGSSLVQQLTSSSTAVNGTTEDLMRDLEHHMIWNDMSLDWSGLDMTGADFVM